MIAKIKANISIIDLAERYNAQPFGMGNVVNTKNNPIRDEKTSSLKLYRETNSFHDFGTAMGGDVIDFYALINNLTTSEAIKELKDDLGIVGDFEPRHVAPVESEYMKPAIVKKIFSMQKEADLKKYSKEIYSIAPKWLFDEAGDIDRNHFFDIVKIDVQDKTANPSSVVLLCDEFGIERSIRYRRKEINGDMKKWVAMRETQSSVHYTRLRDNTPFTLIVEGTHDYLTALLAGYSVVAIPSAKFKLNSALLENRLCVFIDDDDGRDSMRETFDNAICEKIWFDHKAFKTIIGKDTAKDFSDYIEQFNNINEFKNTFDDFILSAKPKEGANFLDIIGRGFTVDFFDNIPPETAIYDGFIFENAINMIYADGGVGKSILALSVINHALTHNKADTAIYLDCDNGLSTLKSRVPEILSVTGDKLQYYGLGLMQKEEIIGILDKLTLIKKQHERVIIVVDSLSFFINDSIMSDADVKPFFEKLKRVRDGFGATIIVLHHVKKPNREDKFPTFYGSNLIKGFVDNAFVMIRDKNKVTIKNEKSRFFSVHDEFEIEIDAKRLVINGTKKIDEVEEEIAPMNQNETIELIHKFLMGCPDNTHVNSKMYLAINEKFGSSITSKDIFKVMQDNNKKLWNTFKNENDEWVYKAIPKHSTTSTVIEYKVPEQTEEEIFNESEMCF